MASPAITVLGQGTTLNAPATNRPPVFAPRARTAVQLPTQEIIGHFDIGLLLKHPTAGSLLWTDFTSRDGLPSITFQNAAALSGGAMVFSWGTTIALGTTAVGTLAFLTTTDNLAAEGQWACPIVASGGNPWAFGVRLHQSTISNTEGNYFAGLMLGQALAGTLLTTNNPPVIADCGAIGFNVKEGDGDKIDFVYNEISQSQVEYDDDYVTQAASTYNTLELYYDGSTIQGYLDGVATGTAIPAATIAGGTFPDGKVLVPTVALKSASGAADWRVTLDWMYAIQHGT